MFAVVAERSFNSHMIIGYSDSWKKIQQSRQESNQENSKGQRLKLINLFIVNELKF